MALVSEVNKRGSDDLKVTDRFIYGTAPNSVHGKIFFTSICIKVSHSNVFILVNWTTSLAYFRRQRTLKTRKLTFIPDVTNTAYISPQTMGIIGSGTLLESSETNAHHDLLGKRKKINHKSMQRLS